MRTKTLKILMIPMLLMIALSACDDEPTSNIPKAPTGLSAYADGLVVYLSWNAVSNADSYKVYYSTDGATYNAINSITTETQFAVQTYTAGTYHFVVTAANDYGESSKSSSVSCYCTDDGNGENPGGEDDPGNDNSVPSAPRGLSASADGMTAYLSWYSVSNANYYTVYCSYGGSSYTSLGSTYKTSVSVNANKSGTFSFKVSASNDYGEGPLSSAASCYCSENGGGGGGDNPGGGNEGTAPSAPTGLTAEKDGPTTYPSVILRWDAVSDATSYIIYRSTSAYGTYSQIGTANYSAYSDDNPKDGTNYYKVKAKNAYGTSDYSDYASVSIDRDAVSPCPPATLKGTVSGYNITMRWTLSNNSGCGKPTKITVRVYEPYQDAGWFDKDVLSGSATSYTFNYPAYLQNGYVKMAVILENDYGTGSKMLIYDANNKKFLEY